ncbi:MAG: hypothetical protein NTZ93_04250 [Candidatus Beckwithbacteria bacterium]|nr:hypothetical protein [Candidatus Beckwithbacteria bacterium]
MIKTFNKKIIFGIAIIIFIVLIFVVFSKKSKPTQTSPSPDFTSFSKLSQPISNVTLPSYTQPRDTAQPAVKTAVSAKQKLLPSLPIYIENFSTSVGITTTINLYNNPLDADYLIHFDIYGIDYQNPTTDENTNPNITAFKESFNHAKNLLQQKGVNLKDLYFIFGGPVYIQQTAELWIKTFSLLN